MAHNGGPPPPPPPPMMRPPGQQPQKPPPPAGWRPPGSGGGMGPGPMQLPPKIIQQSSRIRDITPQKLLTEADCLQKLTTYAAFSVRKVPALSPKERPSWARAEVTEDRLDQADIKKQIKKLGEKGKTVAEKRAALAQFQQGQVTALLDDLISKEADRNFEWSLVQMDLIQKEVPSMKPGKKAIETINMILYVKRAPLPGLNAVMMFQNIEKRRIDSLRPPPPPQQHPPPPPQQVHRPPSAHGMRMPGGGEPILVGKVPKSPKGRPRDKRYHDDDDSSSTGSGGSYDTASDSGSDASSSLDTSISSRSNHRRRRNSRTATRSHSRHRPKYHLENRRQSPEPRPSDAYGVPHHPQQHQQHHPPQQYHQQPPPQRPYVPDVPRMVPALDPITSAYQAGKEDARAEFGERIQSPVSAQPVIIERIIERPVERPPLERVIEQPRIERIVESPRAVVSYTRLPERPRFSEPRYMEDRYLDDVRSQEDEIFIRRREMEDRDILREERLRREAEDYIDRRPLERPEFVNRRQSYSLRGGSSPSLSPTRESFFDRRPSDPREREREFRRPEARRVFSSPMSSHPFAQNLPRRYPPSVSSASYGDPGW